MRSPKEDSVADQLASRKLNLSKLSFVSEQRPVEAANDADLSATRIFLLIQRHDPE